MKIISGGVPFILPQNTKQKTNINIKVDFGLLIYISNFAISISALKEGRADYMSSAQNSTSAINVEESGEQDVQEGDASETLRLAYGAKL